MFDPDAQEADALSGLINDSLEKISANISAVNGLPLSDEYKADLQGILEELHRSLDATRPILDHLGQVRSLIIAPVQTGIEHAFEQSNKWGIRGIKVAIVSMVVTILVGIGGILAATLLREDAPNQFGIGIVGTESTSALGTPSTEGS